MNDALTAQTVELLQQLIRNRCVNDAVSARQEVRTSDVLRGYLDGSGLDVDVYEPDGRRPHEPRRPHRGHRSRRADALPHGHTDVRARDAEH